MTFIVLVVTDRLRKDPTPYITVHPDKKAAAKHLRAEHEIRYPDIAIRQGETDDGFWRITVEEVTPPPPY